jgi:hypothetical protein
LRSAPDREAFLDVAPCHKNWKNFALPTYMVMLCGKILFSTNGIRKFSAFEPVAGRYTETFGF